MDPLLLALGVAIILLLLVLRLTQRHTRRRVRTHARIGRRAETAGLRLLELHGYRIIQRQPLADLVVTIDDAESVFGVRADALVERRGQRFVAEIKGGQVSAALTTRATRRQLLEYSVAFDVDEVLLVDSATDRISHIRFPTRRST